MATRYDDVYVKCPFYLGSTEFTITCEGLNPSVVIENKFRGANGQKYPKKRDAFKEKYCDCGYKQCPINQMLESQYDKMECV